ncbi:ABC transporter ATP-binding protein [Mobilicoccus caccae]|uniref:ABC transporter n=1 Tax=Mobilicoccus caccae TaxID=1859295 RepID=A0ABQ6IQB0_9MICO|nr:ABC transporter ATP-binding protein [Mobilicoccus caccae]GMA40092.1 ABC transporter [Mobilicoccus caccae]
MNAAVEITGLRKDYGRRTALRGIDLTVPHGGIVGFIGPNGAGKTTTMRILLDILRPTAGQVRVLGEDPRKGGAALRSRIGYLPGELRLDGRYDVATLLDHYAAVSSPGRPVARHAWRPLADRLGLDTTRTVRTLSKGNKQKVGLVQAFLHTPELLVLDEPTSGLDPLVQAEFVTMVREAREAGTTVFLSSHVLSEVEQVAESVVVLREGAVVLDSTVARLRADAGTQVRLILAGRVSPEEFTHLEGVRSVVLEPPAESATEPERETTALAVDLAGSPDALVKAAARHTVLHLSAAQSDLEDVVMRLYSKESR